MGTSSAIFCVLNEEVENFAVVKLFGRAREYYKGIWISLYVDDSPIKEKLCDNIAPP